MVILFTALRVDLYLNEMISARFMWFSRKKHIRTMCFSGVNRDENTLRLMPSPPPLLLRIINRILIISVRRAFVFIFIHNCRRNCNRDRYQQRTIFHPRFERIPPVLVGRELCLLKAHVHVALKDNQFVVKNQSDEIYVSRGRKRAV